MKPQTGKAFTGLQSPLIFYLRSTDLLRLIPRRGRQSELAHAQGHTNHDRKAVTGARSLQMHPPKKNLFLFR